MRTSTKTILPLVALIVCVTVNAQTPVPSTVPELKNIKTGNLDFSVPDSPAFTILGVTPQTISRPTTPRGLATSLLNGVDENGNFQTGFALDTAPYMLYWGNRLTLRDYQQSFRRQFMARTTLSIATAKGTNDADKSTRLAAGLRLTIFDKGDPRSDKQFVDQIEKAVTQAIDSITAIGPIRPGSDEETVTKREKAIQDSITKATSAIEQQRAKKLKSGWNASSMVVGFAPSWISKTGSATDLGYNGGAVWSSLSLRLASHAQAIFYGRYQNHQNVPDPNVKGQFFLQDSTFSGGQFRAGTENTVGSFEAVYLHTSPQGKRTDNFSRFSVGAERKIADNLWLHVGIGGESGRQNGQDKMFVLSSLKWGFGSK
jgi:hypothetical protein